MRLIRALILVTFAATTATAAVTLAQYAERLDIVVARMAVLFDEDRPSPSDAQIVTVLDDVRSLLPAKIEVSYGEGVVTADNTALIKALEHLSTRYRSRLGNEADRRDELVDLASQINLLSARVTDANESARRTIIDRQKLETILSREEFKPEIREESRLYKWTRQLWSAFIRLLEQLLTSQQRAPTPGRASLDVVRVLIALGLAAALIMGSIFLLKRLKGWRRRRKSEEESPEVREILGETISEDATAEDLLAKAADLARGGDYRGAIRMAFIALLFELEQRGKVRLDPAKTNHDYLNEVRKDSELVEPVSSLTSVFERVWYGQQGASSEEYVDFVDACRKL